MIPTNVKVGKRKYNIVQAPAQRYRYALGYIEYTPQIIHVHTVRKNGNPISEDKQLEIFWHELTHAILYEMGNKLHRSEAFVTEFSKLLHQAIKSRQVVAQLSERL
jgi:predicted SprT family Zn-dependent metalloprotease